MAIELIGHEQQLFMIINELFLNGSIKPFDVSIHFGRSGIGVPMVLCSRLISSSKCFHARRILWRPKTHGSGLPRQKRSQSSDR